MCEINSKLTIKAPERRLSGVFIVNFEQISQIVLVFPLMTLNKQIPAGIGVGKMFFESITELLVIHEADRM